jgi:hypothetical protein
MNLQKALVGILSGLLCMLHSSESFADRLVFVINTTEMDERGAVTAPYLDEYRWSREWQTIAGSVENKASSEPIKKPIKVVTVRANSNQEITRGLALWLNTPAGMKAHEIAGLGIYSHGDLMRLHNESRDFQIELPSDLKNVLAPAVGRFAKGARIFFSGCNVLWGQSEITAESSLKSIAEALHLSDGIVYANYSKGFDPYTLVVSPFNSDVKLNKRLASLATYLIWPVSIAALPLFSNYIFNQGYALAVRGTQTKLLKVQQNQIFK